MGYTRGRQDRAQRLLGRRAFVGGASATTAIVVAGGGGRVGARTGSFVRASIVDSDPRGNGLVVRLHASEAARVAAVARDFRPGLRHQRGDWVGFDVSTGEAFPFFDGFTTSTNGVVSAYMPNDDPSRGRWLPREDA